MQQRACLIAAVVAAVCGRSATAQQLFGESVKRALPPDTPGGTAVITGDVDGDGHRDLLIAKFGQTRLFLNDGNGQFLDVTATHLPIANHPTAAIALGDIDGDSDLDLVLGNAGNDPGPRRNRAYLNDGSGQFTDATAAWMPTTAVETYAVVLGDVDGDGDLDLVTGDYGLVTPTQGIRLALNNGATFVPAPLAVPADTSPTRDLAFDDVDGDGDPDLVVATGGSLFSGVQNRLLLNDGAGTFTDGTAAMPQRAEVTPAIALGDVDGDGDVDLFEGGFFAAMSHLALNDGLGNFTPAPSLLPASSGVLAATLDDLDGDGDRDLVTIGFADLAIYENTGPGGFVDVTGTRWASNSIFGYGLALADLQGDSDPDLVAVQDHRGISIVAMNDGSGTFANATAHRGPRFHTELAIADVDRDGDLDLVTGRYGGAVPTLYLNDGRGEFADHTVTNIPALSTRTRGFEFGDVDGDGDDDLMLANYGGATGEQNRLYLNDGTGTFTDQTAALLPLDSDMTAVARLVDVDGDNDLDAVLGNSATQNRLYENVGGSFVDVTAQRLPVDGDVTQVAAVGDVNGDGRADIVFGNGGNLAPEQNRLLLNTPTGTFVDATGNLPAVTDHTRAVVLGDFDSDGDLDLVVGNYGEQNRLYRNNGTGTFTDVTATWLPQRAERTTWLLRFDADQDGFDDLLVANRGQQNRLLLQRPGALLEATSLLPLDGDWTNGLAAGDVDRDGDPDLFVGNWGGTPSRILRGLRRQLDSPRLLQVGLDYELEIFVRRGGSAGQVDVALPFFSTLTANLPVPGVGILALDPNALVTLPPVPVPQPSGFASILIPVPNVPAIAGLTFHSQALLATGSFELTNPVRDVAWR